MSDAENARESDTDQDSSDSKGGSILDGGGIDTDARAGRSLAGPHRDRDHLPREAVASRRR